MRRIINSFLVYLMKLVDQANNKVKEDEMGGPCSTNGVEEERV
jgi:hypothetical protein